MKLQHTGTYLIRRHNPKVYHVMKDSSTDTYCKMYSTGGLNPRKYISLDYLTDDLPICTQCKTNSAKGMMLNEYKRN